MGHFLFFPSTNWRFRLGLLLVALFPFTMTACRVTDVPLWGPSHIPANAFDVERIPDVSYYEGPDRDDFRNRLDLYLPCGLKDFPVVVLIHGGAWTIGD